MATIILNVSIYLLLSNNVKWIKFSIEIFFRFCWLVFKCVYGRLKNFNSILEDLHRTQMQWTIWDTDLRDAVRLQVAEVLLPAYRSFIKRYSSILTSDTGHSNKYMKYSPEDLESLLGEFFEGKIITEHHKGFLNGRWFRILFE